MKIVMQCMLVRRKDPLMQDLMNIDNSAVSPQRSQNTFTLIIPIIQWSWNNLIRESIWFERGAKEDVYIRGLNPSLNREKGRCYLPPVWDNIIKKGKADRPRKELVGEGSTSSHTMPPTVSGRQQN